MERFAWGRGWTVLSECYVEYEMSIRYQEHMEPMTYGVLTRQEHSRRLQGTEAGMNMRLDSALSPRCAECRARRRRDDEGVPETKWAS